MATTVALTGWPGCLLDWTPIMHICVHLEVLKLFSLRWVQNEGESWSSVASAGLKDFQVSFRTKSSLAK